MTQLFAEVAVNSTLPHRQTFSYSLPEDLDARAGQAVYVPFGRKLLQGVIVEVHSTPMFSEPEKIRQVVSLVGDDVLVEAARLTLARWIAHEYIAPIYDCISLMLPPGFDQRPITYVRALIDADELASLNLSERSIEVMRLLTEQRRISIDDLRERASFKSVDAVVLQLERRDLARREYALQRPRIAARTVTIATLAVSADDAHDRVLSAEQPKPSRRAALLERLLERRSLSDDEAIRLAGSRANLERLVRAGSVRPDREGHMIELAMSPGEARDEIQSLRLPARSQQALRVIDVLARGQSSITELHASGAATSVINWMGALGVVALRDVPDERDPLAQTTVERRPRARLLASQQSAADAICNALAGPRSETFLLHGVTGSGKTEVYLQALDACVEQGRRAIVLVPEIALTPQTVRRFRERFERVAVLHSGLSDGERFDQWHGIAAGRYDVVIGSRSAIFAPQPNLGLIVLDEEHEWTYKQSEAAPRYHARAVALELAQLKSAVLVLGSATPDIESYDRAQRGAYTLLALPERVRPSNKGAPAATLAMPPISVVDLRDELHAGNRSMFSRELHEALRETLDANEQAILFLNRRGLAGHVQCRDCGFVPECAGCPVALTYHRAYDRLVCHQCNRQQRLATACKQCGSPRIRLVGAGVEKVEAETERAFPDARLLRWDRDVTRGRRSHDDVLTAFLRRDADILIGTQMLAKGLDLPGITLVGVMNADIGLHLPDFRASERTFQLLTQVAGRSGRGERDGRVIVQTYQPDHPAIEAAARYDYHGFAASELDMRRLAHYPPYARLVRLAFGHTNAAFAREEARRLQRALTRRRVELGSDSDILGPSPAYVARLRGRWRWQLVLRGRDPAALVRDFVLPPGWTVDVDPQTIA